MSQLTTRLKSLHRIEDITLGDLHELLHDIERLEAEREKARFPANDWNAKFLYADGNEVGFDLRKVGWSPDRRFPREILLPMQTWNFATFASQPTADMAAVMGKRAFGLYELDRWNGRPIYREKP